MKRLTLLLTPLVATLALADLAPPKPTEAPPPAPAAEAAKPAEAAAADVAKAAEPAPTAEAPKAEAPAPAPAPMHPQGIEKAGPSGVVEGGWGYVYACYILAVGGSALYGLSLFLRRPTGALPPGDAP